MRNLLKEQAVKFGLRVAPEGGHAVTELKRFIFWRVGLSLVSFLILIDFLPCHAEYLHVIINRLYSTIQPV